MSISREEAASALSQIDQTTERSRELKGYRIAGPIAMVWGVIWAIGYCGMVLMPHALAGKLWIGLDFVGMALTLLLLRRNGAVMKGGWKQAATFLAIFAFVSATLSLFRPAVAGAHVVYPGLVCGFIYTLFGLWRLPRLAWIGAAMFAASWVGLYLVPQGLIYWMAVVGGGGLFLGGLWLRKA